MRFWRCKIDLLRRTTESKSVVSKIERDSRIFRPPLKNSALPGCFKPHSTLKGRLFSTRGTSQSIKLRVSRSSRSGLLRSTQHFPVNLGRPLNNTSQSQNELRTALPSQNALRGATPLRAAVRRRSTGLFSAVLYSTDGTSQSGVFLIRAYLLLNEGRHQTAAALPGHAMAPTACRKGEISALPSQTSGNGLKTTFFFHIRPVDLAIVIELPGCANRTCRSHERHFPAAFTAPPGRDFSTSRFCLI